MPFLQVIISPLKKFGMSFLSFALSRPRIDVNIVPREDDLYGQKVLQVAHHQDYEAPIPPQVRYDFQFFWNYEIIIKNNSSKTAYNVKIEKIYKGIDDYLGKIDEVISLKEGEKMIVDYKLRFKKTCNSAEAERIRVPFPPYLNEIDIIVSYTNEARLKFFTNFKMTSTSKVNEHLIMKPKELKTNVEKLNS